MPNMIDGTTIPLDPAVEEGGVNVHTGVPLSLFDGEPRRRHGSHSESNEDDDGSLTTGGDEGTRQFFAGGLALVLFVLVVCTFSVLGASFPRLMDQYEPSDPASLVTRAAVATNNNNLYSSYGLETKQFQDVLKDSKYAFVFFHAPYCPVSSQFEPVWGEVAKEASDEKNVRTIQVNCELHPEVCRQETVFSFPTIRWYENGNFVDEVGFNYSDRTASALITFAANQIACSNSNSNQPVASCGLAKPGLKPLRSLSENDLQGATMIGPEEEKTAFVVFVSKSNRNSRDLTKAWQIQDELNQNEGLPARVFQVDCSEQVDYCRKQGIVDFPTLRWFDHGALTVPDYKGSFLSSGSRARQAEADRKLETRYKQEGFMPNVQKLTSATFDDFLVQHKYVFVTFGAPWCGYSQRLVAIWSRFAQNPGSDVEVVHVDCTDQSDLCREQNINAYPTLRWFTNGQPHCSDYKEERTVEAFRSYAQDQVGAALVASEK